MKTNFNLNGDITRQLNIRFKASFKIKYKKEIKERLISFISLHINNLYSTSSFLEKLNLLSKLIEFDNEGNIKSFSEEYFQIIKIDLLHSFNPIWYVLLNEENKQKYNKKELKNFLYLYVNSFSIDSLEKLVEHSEFKKNILNPCNILLKLNIFNEKLINNNIVFDNFLKKNLIDFIYSEYISKLLFLFKEHCPRAEVHEYETIFKKITYFFDEEFHLSSSTNSVNFVIQKLLSEQFFSKNCSLNVKKRCFKYDFFNISEIVISIYYLLKIIEDLKK